MTDEISGVTFRLPPSSLALFRGHLRDLPRYKRDEREHHAQDYEHDTLHPQNCFLVTCLHNLPGNLKALIIDHDRTEMRISGLRDRWVISSKLFCGAS